ncbi:mucin-associated surface protein (MASP), putative [Trypanosoma cruzi marinkellei]|uniref:Mucin-associated surface protein (MASP), putative n=1 Tax=Trypanosoma cruzi marinkellei TaxID=85056 RepID=K2MSK8_TRYCR|nr:mucin-associated surface protein (MASP), putative [Trypanosoma cruzi marinkellei]
MMMTGRVLWVCALCVLWCGVCCGGGTPSAPVVESDTKNEHQIVSGSSQTSSDTGVSVTENKIKNINGTTVDAGGVQGVTTPALHVESSKTGVKAAEATLSQAPNSGEATGKVQAETEQSGEKRSKEKEEEENEEEGEVVEDVEEKDEGEEEDEEEGDEEGDEEGEGDDKENVTGSQKGMSAGGQEQPSLSSGAEGASNKTNLNSTQTTDGSTTASHSTTPVLLLLLAACAAAAVVVAA